ncbi:peroxisomal targeting signal 2 receptor [Rhizophlyctis rosea]|nr:peroxisomal targeting signal 2 receptor [Rhizophlyctis rosea]
MAAPLAFRTQGYNGYGVEFSPFFENRLACVSGANFGIVGNGRLWLLNVTPGGIGVDKTYDTQDGLFDCAWSEIHENQLVTSSGDGSIKLWDATLPDFPIRNWTEHTREVFSVNWNMVQKDTFVSGSWDMTIKLWNPEIPQSIQTWREHSNCIYVTTWSPTDTHIFASASGDNTIKVWDTRLPTSIQTIPAHPAEILALDWNKYQPGVLVSGSVDHTIKVWDIRFPSRERNILRGHEYAVRRVKCSPHRGNVVVSTSYDMTMRVWDMEKGVPVFVHDAHTEFVLGVDLNIFFEGQIATCAWDESVHIVNVPPM